MRYLGIARKEKNHVVMPDAFREMGRALSWSLASFSGQEVFPDLWDKVEALIHARLL